MSDHLSAAVLSAFADCEISGDEAVAAKEHLEDCRVCAASLIDALLLKGAVRTAAPRHEMPAEVESRLAALIHQRGRASDASPAAHTPAPPHGWRPLYGWAAAAVLIVLLGWGAVQFRAAETRTQQAFVTEISDLHIAALASTEPPQVVSSDRHTVKPWFQGKLPFSFNLPETLPADTRLAGANLAYVGDRPVAQLLFSIGRHRASVFVEQRTRAPQMTETPRAGFQIVEFTTADLEVILISDVDRSRLTALADELRAAQSRE